MNPPKDLNTMSGKEAWEAYYRDEICSEGFAEIDRLRSERAFLAGVGHAIDYVRSLHRIEGEKG